jgi:quercetin dioxygenase-like cupin family protein
MLLLVLSFTLALSLLASEPIQFSGDQELQWRDAPPTATPGAKMAIMEGNPRQAGLFTMRLRLEAGTVIKPHWHPRPERVTVLSGRVEVGFGDSIDQEKKGVKSFGPGGFYVNPPDRHHYVVFPEKSVIQITGEGPWEVDYVQ